MEDSAIGAYEIDADERDIRALLDLRDRCNYVLSGETEDTADWYCYRVLRELRDDIHGIVDTLASGWGWCNVDSRYRSLHRMRRSYQSLETWAANAIRHHEEIIHYGKLDRDNANNTDTCRQAAQDIIDVHALLVEELKGFLANYKAS